jgi:hypothetical protein
MSDSHDEGAVLAQMKSVCLIEPLYAVFSGKASDFLRICRFMAARVVLRRLSIGRKWLGRMAGHSQKRALCSVSIVVSATMKKLMMIALLATVSWALAGAPAQAAEASNHSVATAKHHHKHHKHHKKHKKA